MSDAADKQVLDYIPEQVPARSVTSDGVNYPAEDSAGVPWDQATIRVRGEQRPLADHDLDGIGLDRMRLYDDIEWDEIDLAVVANLPNGWQTLLLVTLVEQDGQRFLEGVSVPTASFARGANPPQWRSAFAVQLRQRVDAGLIDVVEDNLDILLSWADEAY